MILCLSLAWVSEMQVFKVVILSLKGYYFKMVFKQMLFVLLLMTLAHGQTPKFARLPDRPFTQYMISIWADYSYRIHSVYSGNNKYYYHINFYLFYMDFDEDYGTYQIIFNFVDISGQNPPVQFNWRGSPSSLGNNQNGFSGWQFQEIVSVTTYQRPHSPLFESTAMSGGLIMCTKTGMCGTAGYSGDIQYSYPQIPGPIMGFVAAGWDWQDYSVTYLSWYWFSTIHDLAWCQNENIPTFTIMSGTYGYDFVMGTPVQIPVDHTYHSWDFYSNYCTLTMKKLSITHRIHTSELNLSMDYLNVRLWNEQAWMVLNVGTQPKYQILPQQNTCVTPINDCLSIDKMGGVCVVLDPITFVPSPSTTNFAPTAPTTWTPNCNQDMTVKNKTDPVITYAQNPKADNRRGVITLSTIDPWMEGIHTMRLRIYNAGGYYQDPQTGLPWITTDMTQDIVFRVRHNCLYTFIQYNTTYKTYGGKIQDMTVPVSTTQYQDLLPCFSHTYAYRWPPLACNMGFTITSGPSNIMTLVGNELTVITTNPLDVGTWDFTIKVYIIEAQSIFWSLPMKVTITPPCNIVSYKVYKNIPADTRYVIGLFQEMPLEFSFTFLNTPCDLWQFHWFTVTDITTGLDISTTQNFISIEQDGFPVQVPKYPRLVVLSHVIADRGTYLVQVYARLATDPIRLSSDHISFTLTMDIDKCLLTYIDDQLFADQAFTIDLNAPPTMLVYKQFEDWVTRDANHDCGPRRYELSATGGGSTGKYLPSPGLLPAVPNLINFQSNNAQTCIIQIQTTDPYAVGVYTVQMIISLQNWPLYYTIQKLVKTFKVTINSVCLTKSEILYSTFPLLSQKVSFIFPVTANTFTFNPVPDLMSSIYAPNDGVSFCYERAYSGFRVTCSDCLFVIPAALITYPGTVFTLNPATFMYVKQNPTLDTTFTVNSESQAPNQRSYWGQYTIYFSVGFLAYQSFLPQEFSFPAQIVPDCQNAIITGPTILNMQTYINTPVQATYLLSAHDEFNVYNYYCDNGLSTGGITYTLLNGSGLPSVQTYLTMTVTTVGITLTVNTQDPTQASTVPYAHSIQQCLTYYPTNCITKPFTVTLNPDCTVISYDSTDVPQLQETYQVGQISQSYPITFATGFAPSGPTGCVYFYHFQVMVDGVDRTSSMPAWLTTTLTSMAISSSSSADVGKHDIKVYSFLDKVPVFPTNLNTQIPTQVIIEIMFNPCVNTQIWQTLQGLAFSYTITYNTVPMDFTNPGYTDSVTVSGAANCGQIIYTVTDITGADYSPYMKFTVDGRTNTVTFSVSTQDASLIGIHNFKVHANLQQFPALDPMIGIDNFFSITIASSCVTDVIYRPKYLPDDIKTTIDSPSKSYVFQPVQDSISTNVGFTSLTDSGGLCGPWAFDIRVGNFYKKEFSSGGIYILQTDSPQGLAIVAPGRTLVIDGQKNKKYIGKQQIFITVTSTVYPVIRNEFEVMIWVYNYCSNNELTTSFVLPNAWKPLLVTVQGGDPTKTTFPEWTLQTDADYFQDWGVSYEYICGPRQFQIKTNSIATAIAPAWITSSMQKNSNSVGYVVPVVLQSINPGDVGKTKLVYCATLTNFDNFVCSEFNVLIRSADYLTFNKPPNFVYMGLDPKKGVQTFGIAVKHAIGYIECLDRDSSYDQLQVKVFMSTQDAIDPAIWALQKWVDVFDGSNVVGGILDWTTNPSDDGKKVTIKIECSDGMYTVSQSLAIEVVYRNKTTGDSSDANSTALNFKNNKPEEETVKFDTTQFANKIKASVQVGGRNYTLVRPTVYIKSIDNQGLVTIRFSEDMVFQAGIETDQIMMKKQLRLNYISGFYGDEIGWDKNLNNMKWVVSSVEKREMHVQLTWKAPGWVSQGSGFDKLRVTFLEAGAFINRVGTSIQDETTFTQLEFFLQAQIDKNAKSSRNSGAISKSLGTAGSTLVCSGVAMTVIMGVGMAEIWGMINGVQLLIFSPALRLKMPAIAQMFIGNIIQMATFDYIPMDVVFESQFDLSNYEAVNPYLNAVGLNTSWFILNIGSQWLFLAFAVIGLLLLPILSVFSNKTGLLKKQVANLKSQLMWSYFILFMTSMSLEISLACLIQYQKLVWKFQGSDETVRRLKTEDGSSAWLAEIISTYSAIIIGGVFVIFNAMTPVFLFRNFRNLDHPVVKGPWGKIYNDVRIEKWSLFYPNILMAKRIIIAVVLLYLTINGFTQVLVLQFISIFSLIYLGNVKPMCDQISQTFEVLNEVMVILLSYALMMFNDYLNPDQRDWMGWYLCGVVGIYLSLHITRLGLKKFYQLVKAFRDRCFKWQINRLMAARQKLLITQLKASNQIEPEIELHGISPRLMQLKFRRRLNLTIEEEYDLSPRQTHMHVLSEVETGQLAKGVQSELTHDADAGVFDTGVLYHLNQPRDQILNLMKINAGTSDESVILSSVDSLAVDSSSQSEVSFRQTPRQSWFVIPEMPNEDIL